MILYRFMILFTLVIFFIPSIVSLKVVQKSFSSHLVSVSTPSTKAFAAKLLIFHVDFDQDLFLRPSNLSSSQFRCTIQEASSDSTCRKLLFGLTRLICSSTLFESHGRDAKEKEESGVELTSSPNNSPIPFLVPAPLCDKLPLVAILEPSVTHQNLPAHRYSAVLMISTEDKNAHAILHSIIGSRCELRFLDASSQDFLPSSQLVSKGGDDDPFIGSVYFNITDDQSDNTNATSVEHSISTLQSAMKHFTPFLFALPPVSNAQNDQSPAFLQMQEHEKMKLRVQGIAGMVKGLIQGVLEPVADMFGSIAGDALIEMIAAPIVMALLAGVCDLFTESIREPLAYAVSSLIPSAISQIVADRVPDQVADAVSRYVLEHGTPPLTSELHSRLMGSLPPLLDRRVGVEGGLEIAKELTFKIGSMLARSLPHSIVPAFTHTLTHSPLSDYYCFYCHHHNEYCQYCHLAPSQLYFQMYYTGFYSSYYAPYYSEFFSKHPGVKYVRKKAPVFKDKTEFPAS